MLALRSSLVAIVVAGCGSDSTPPCTRDGDCGAGMRCEVGSGLCLRTDAGSSLFDAAGADAGATSDGGSTSDAAGTDSGMSSSDAGESPFDAAACGPDPVPPAPEPCPEACTGGCDGTLCTIDCTGDGACDGRDIECPEQYACRVVCDGVDACDSGSIRCPPMHACTIVCGGGNDACGDQVVTCGNATCAIECAADACSGATLRCGTGPCTATCEGAPQPSLECAGACLCAGC